MGYATAASGSVTVSGSGTSAGSDGTCTIDIQSTNQSISAGGGTMAIQAGPEPHGIQLPFSGFVQATFTCPNQDPFTTPFSPPAMMIYTEDPEQTMTRRTYQGSSTLTGSGFSSNYNWSLVDP